MKETLKQNNFNSFRVNMKKVSMYIYAIGPKVNALQKMMGKSYFLHQVWDQWQIFNSILIGKKIKRFY